MQSFQKIFTPLRVAALFIACLLILLVREHNGSSYGASDYLSSVGEDVKVSEDMKIAILTFITHETSYTHLSMNNRQGRSFYMLYEATLTV